MTRPSSGLPILPWLSLMSVCFVAGGTVGLQAASLTVTKSGSGSGTIVSSPPGIDCGSDCEESFPQGTEVQLQAVPGGGSEFGGWSGSTDCLDGVVTMNAAKVCTGDFDPCSILPDVPVTGTSVDNRRTFHACNHLTVGPSVVVGSTGRADFTVRCVDRSPHSHRR